MKKLFKHIRYRICRNIYYADWCPADNRKNYKEIAVNAIACFGLCLSAVAIFCFMFLIA